MERESTTTCTNLIVKNFKEVKCGKPVDRGGVICAKCRTAMVYFSKMESSQNDLEISLNCDRICKISSTVLVDELSALEASIKEAKKELRGYVKNGIRTRVEMKLRELVENRRRDAMETIPSELAYTIGIGELITIALDEMIGDWLTVTKGIVSRTHLGVSIFKSVEIAARTDKLYQDLANMRIDISQSSEPRSEPSTPRRNRVKPEPPNT